MKDKEKEKEKDREKEPLARHKQRPHSKKLKTASKRMPEAMDNEPEDAKAEEPEVEDLAPADAELELDPDELEDVEEEPEAEVEAEVEVPAPPPPKSGKSRRGAKGATDAEKNGDSAKPQSRLGLIRARHESMKREIEQIREDLDSDEEE